MCLPTSRPRQLDEEAQSLGLQYGQVHGVPIRIVEVEGSGPVASLSPSQAPRDLLCETPSCGTPPLCEPRCHSPPRLQRAGAAQPQRCDAESTLPGHEGLRTTVFFIHGLGGRAGQFRHQIHFLAQRGCRCIAVDLPGHGESPVGGFDRGMVSLDRTREIVKAIFDAMSDTRTIERSSPVSTGSAAAEVLDATPERERGPTGAELHLETPGDCTRSSSLPGGWHGEPNGRLASKNDGEPHGEDKSGVREVSKPRRRAVLIGHSLGALYALTLFADLAKEGRSAEVSGIVLIGALAAYPHTRVQHLLPCMPAVILELLRGLIKRQVQRQLFHPSTLLQNARLVRAEDSVTRNNPMSVILSILRDLQTSRPSEFIEEGIRAYHEATQRPSILLLTGEEDVVCPMKDNAMVLKREFLGLTCANVKQRTHGAEEIRGAQKHAETSKGAIPHSGADHTMLSEITVAHAPEETRHASKGGQSLGPNDATQGSASQQPHATEKGKATRPAVEVEVVPCTGHNCMLEDPYTTNRIIWDFVKKATRNVRATNVSNL
ncbi:conserved hypothetical protein [Neospora caninum Liverpool]|uniref:Putative lysophospholipase,domain-containing n=1 Tax=Neospora caninum (strain Liverpool) TaxID=572307 RepID=F0VMM5_NEOCL|nr:conserved hypothetical protein [Neospora caninum Liverpool]CBZ54971.1 conserved hypothetical protein [Neospora caninum Liverpool]CEL69693.1 TPA: Putative lysophospholipase,domain-containing [Neospora caninum Liverpool]|eukprot:XP_003884999.1 conserved hypothetical protein [Neospora caninum Liverpool]